jgi:hypothetical protein
MGTARQSSKGAGVNPEDPPLRWEIRALRVAAGGRMIELAFEEATGPRNAREAYRAVAAQDLDSFSLELRRDLRPNAAESGTYRLVIDAGSAGREEHEGLTLEKGRDNIATKVNAASKLIKIEETGASLPEARVTRH